MRQIAAACLALLAACTAPHENRPGDLAAQLDCLREGGMGVVAAHRGQSDPSAAENAMSSFRATLAAGVPWLEIDIAATKDGVLVLMHDDTLDRTTTGSGKVQDHTFDQIRQLHLKRPDGTILDERVPTLAEALAWGRGAGAHFELDVKSAARFADVLDEVRAARMGERVLVVTYTVGDAAAVHRLDARIMISVTLDRPELLATARRAVDARRMLGWTGNREPDPRLLAALRAAGIEPIFGTLGRPGSRLDDVYLEDGNGSEYADLVKAGVVMIASDSAVAAQRAIGAEWRKCVP
ncbi:MAG: glycerophosphodiester phosphodiesterase family protein [Vicinamibacterales bacterium]